MKKIENTEEETLYSRIAEVIEGARHQVAQTANLTMVYCYYEIGRMIVEDEQQGNHRAGYGEKTLQGLSVKLTNRFGNGFSYRNLKLFRQFYIAYSPSNTIGQTSSAQLTDTSTLAHCEKPHFSLGWSHYSQLLRVEDPLARRFYEIEAAKESIAAQISEGTPPEYVLYSALQLIGLLTHDNAWSEDQRAKLDKVYEDLAQISLLADNEAIGRARLEEQKRAFSDKVLRRLNRTKKECEKMAEALNQAIAAAQRIADDGEILTPDQ